MEATLPFEAHRVGHQPPARGQGRPARGEEVRRRREAAAREDRVGRAVEVRERFGGRAAHDVEGGRAEAFGVALDEAGAPGAPLDRDRARAPRGPHPLDADRAAPGPDVPEEVSGAGGEGGERRRPEHALGELPVVLERVVREARHARQEGRIRGRGARAFDGDGVEVPHVRERESVGGGLADPFVRPREVLQHDHPAPAVARLAEHRGDPRRGRRVVAEHEHPGARRDRGAERGRRAPVQGEGLDLRQAPAEACAGEAEGGGGRDDPHLGGREAARDRGPDPVAERVAGREHAHPPPGTRAKLAGEGGEGARPFEAFAAAVRRDHGEVAGAADQGIGRVDGGAGARPETVEAVLADPDDGEPGGHAAPAVLTPPLPLPRRR